MENDYKTQQSSNDSTISEMEKRMVELRANVDRLQQLKQKLDEEKVSLVKTNETLQLQVKHILRNISLYLYALLKLNIGFLCLFIKEKGIILLGFDCVIMKIDLLLRHMI